MHANVYYYIFYIIYLVNIYVSFNFYFMYLYAETFVVKRREF